MFKQVEVADIFRRFADALDDPYSSEERVRSDPGDYDLARLLDAIGSYARECGTDLRGLTVGQKAWELMHGEGRKIISRKLTDEVRRFADMLERKQDLVHKVDPGYKRLASAVKAANIYARSIGADLGLGSGWGAIVKDKIG